MVPTDFIFPKGRLIPAMLGVVDDDALVKVVEQYVADGALKSVGAARLDDAIEAYVYWRGFDAAATLRATSPVQTTVPDDFAETYGSGQASYLANQARHYAALWQTLLPAATARPVGPAQSTARRTIVQW